MVERRPRPGSSGFSLIEILLALSIVAVALVPMLDFFGTSMESGAAGKETEQLVDLARATLEEILAMNYQQVVVSGSSPSATLSDTVVLGGEQVKRDVYVDLYDGNGDGIPDLDLKKITVQIRDFRLQTLKADA